MLQKLYYKAKDWANSIEDGLPNYKGKTIRLYAYCHPFKFLTHYYIPSKVENFTRTLYDAELWLRYRFDPKNRFNVVYTELEPQYYDTDYRMLFANFKLLREFVEEENHCHQDIETISKQFYDYLKINDDWKPHIKWFRESPKKLQESIMYWVAYVAWCKERWAENDNPPEEDFYNKFPEHQYKAALEVDELYRWWLFERPYEEKLADNYKTRKQEFIKRWPGVKYFEVSSILFEKDNEQLIRLMKIRGSLWT